MELLEKFEKYQKKEFKGLLKDQRILQEEKIKDPKILHDFDEAVETVKEQKDEVHNLVKEMKTRD